MVDALDSKSSSQKSVGSSPTAGIKKLVEKGGSFTTAALSFSALYATKRNIVRHLRYALLICPAYAHFMAPVYAHFLGAGGRALLAYFLALSVQKEDLPERPLGRSLENVTSEPSFLMRSC